MQNTKDAAPSRYVSSPLLIDKAEELALYLKTLSTLQVKRAMNLSDSMAVKTQTLLQAWDSHASTLPAIDAFLGDIYSGLQAKTFSMEDRAYAHEHLYILSGLYGVLRALDATQSYRLEMGYKLPGPTVMSLYDFWGDAIARVLPKGQPILNLSAVEYTKALFPFIKKMKEFDGVPIISPRFLTINFKTGHPTFVTVHAKIARGAFARWVIQNRVESVERLVEFNDLGYRYDAELSTDIEPVFVAQQFEGLGLSVRLGK